MHTVGADYPVVVTKVRNEHGAKGMGQLTESGLPTMVMGGASFSLCRLEAVRPWENGWDEPYELRGSRTVLGSSRQGCNPAGESPAMSIARFRHVAIPRFMTGNRMFIAWCKRPGRLVCFTYNGGSNRGSSEHGSLNITE
jgi:hypothetical protein